MQQILGAARAAGRTALSEIEAKQLISQFGIRIPASVVVYDENDLGLQASRLRPPFALKAISPTLLHKSDAGGVRLKLASREEVIEAMRAMHLNPKLSEHQIQGFLLEEMAAPGHEIAVGGTWHPHFGPVLMVGLGGVFVEVFSDVSFRICPIERIDAEEMITELRGAAVLAGARGGPVACRDAIVAALMAIGGPEGLIVAAAGDIAEVDVNPIIVDAIQASAVDARIVLRGTAP
jgi:acetyl-CoA synthetase (ADP-forming)